MTARPSAAAHVRAHLTPFLRRYIAGRRRNRAAMRRALDKGCTSASFVEFMDTVCPDWRVPR